MINENETAASVTTVPHHTLVLEIPFRKANLKTGFVHYYSLGAAPFNLRVVLTLKCMSFSKEHKDFNFEFLIIDAIVLLF